MPKSAKPWKEYGRYGSVGIELVASVMLGWYAGHWADGKWAGGHGWVTALGFMVGTYAGFRALFITASRMQKDIERAERAERGEDRWSPSPPPDNAPNSPPRDPRKNPDEPSP